MFRAVGGGALFGVASVGGGVGGGGDIVGEGEGGGGLPGGGLHGGGGEVSASGERDVPSGEEGDPVVMPVVPNVASWKVGDRAAVPDEERGTAVVDSNLLHGEDP